MPAKNSTLYRISLGSKVHHIFGTIHLPHNCIKWPVDDILILLSGAEVYYSEMNLDHQDHALVKYQLLNDGKTWLDLVGEKKYLKHKKLLDKAFQIDIGKIHNLKPFLWESVLIRSIVGNAGLPMDYFLWSQAKSEKIPVFGLESLQDQIAILQKMDVNYQIQKLNSILRNVSTYKRGIMKLIRDYESQRIRQLHDKALRSLGKYRRLLVYDRNLAMANKIDSIQEKEAMITMGAGHLWGNQGILALLKRRGWKVLMVEVSTNNHALSAK